MVGRSFTFGAVFGLSCAVGALGQVVHVEIPAPTMDRWMYPFNFSSGSESQSPVFGAIREPGFDDRDGQFLVGWRLPDSFPVGLEPARYRVVSARVTAWISNDRWRYDPTPDPVSTLFDVLDPEYTPDSDLGVPVEVFAVEYRNGFTPVTFQENSAFSPNPPGVPPQQEGVRNAFPAVFDGDGVATDVSRQVRQRFDAAPMALGINTSLTPGQVVPPGTPLVFELDVFNAENARFLGERLSAGEVRVILTSLDPASGGQGGGTGGNYPAFYTRENPLAPILGYTASLSLEVEVLPACDADVNCDGSVDQGDVACIILAVAGDTSCFCQDEADFNRDGSSDQGDIASVIGVVAGAECP